MSPANTHTHLSVFKSLSSRSINTGFTWSDIQLSLLKQHTRPFSSPSIDAPPWNRIIVALVGALLRPRKESERIFSLMDEQEQGARYNEINKEKGGWQGATKEGWAALRIEYKWNGVEEWSGGWGGGTEVRRGMNKRASGIEGEGDPLRQEDCEWEKLLSLSVRPGLPPPRRVVSLRGRKCSRADNRHELRGHTRFI